MGDLQRYGEGTWKKEVLRRNMIAWTLAVSMPKLKARKAAAKRFRATGNGKFMRRRAFHNHLLDPKSPKRKRFLKTMACVNDRDADNVSLMLPYSG